MILPVVLCKGNPLKEGYIGGFYIKYYCLPANVLLILVHFIHIIKVSGVDPFLLLKYVPIVKPKSLL